MGGAGRGRKLCGKGRPGVGAAKRGDWVSYGGCSVSICSRYTRVRRRVLDVFIELVLLVFFVYECRCFLVHFVESTGHTHTVF